MNQTAVCKKKFFSLLFAALLVVQGVFLLDVPAAAAWDTGALTVLNGEAALAQGDMLASGSELTVRYVYTAAWGEMKGREHTVAVPQGLLAGDQCTAAIADAGGTEYALATAARRDGALVITMADGAQGEAPPTRKC